jgi:rSAM/selenodomain-associated transferase 2
VSVVIPALDAAAILPAALAALEEGRSLIGEILVADGGSSDGTVAAARAAGALVVVAPRGRGQQLALGAAAARGAWLMFLHADTRLGPGWAGAAQRFIADGRNRERAGYFRFRLDDEAAAARRVERWVAWRGRLGLPYGDQGLILSRALYDRVGGFRALALMEDVDLVRRIGRGKLVPLGADAVTSAARYRRAGYLRRGLRNLCCLALWHAGVPLRLVVKLYG